MRLSVSSRRLAISFSVGSVSLSEELIVDNYPWPNAVDSHASKELAHAIGVLTINWNWCEFMLDFILFDFIDVESSRTGIRITGLMNNRMKCDLLAGLIADTGNEDLIDCMEHFIKFFDICRENRNLVMHGTLDATGEHGHDLALVQTKYAKEIFSRALPVTVENLTERVAETQALYDYAGKINDAGRFGGDGKPLPLPDKPPLPRKLTTTLPLHKSEILQRES